MCPFLLPDFNETWVFWADFWEVFKYQNFMKIRPVGAEFRADGQTDMTNVTVAFRNLAITSVSISMPVGLWACVFVCVCLCV